VLVILVIEAVVIGAYMMWGINRTGSLKLISSPPGARVLLNLEPTAYMTDTLITGLVEGKYSVTLDMKGHVAEPFVQVVHVQRNRLSAASFNLKPAPAEIAQVIPEPEPETPRKTRPEYKPSFPIPETKFQKPKPGEDTFDTTEEKTPTISREPSVAVSAPGIEIPTSTETPEFGALDVASNIFGADIYMDGKPTGQKTNATLLVPIGVHRFSVRKDHYIIQPEEVIVEIKPSDTEKFILFELIQDLESLPYRIIINTEPVAGGVTIDDIYRGRGTVNLEVDPGEYLVAFEPVEGYETPESRKVTLTRTNRTVTVTGTYQRRLEYSMFIDSLGQVQRFGDIRMDRGYFLAPDEVVVDTMWGPAVKFMKSLNNYFWELGWGNATRNPTGQDYLRFFFDVPEDFARDKPLVMKLYILRSSKNYPLTILNRSELNVTVNGELALDSFTPEVHIKDNNPDAYKEVELDPYLKPGKNEIMVRPTERNQTFCYCQGIEIR
jgi:hypothetical protein